LTCTTKSLGTARRIRRGKGKEPTDGEFYKIEASRLEDEDGSRPLFHGRRQGVQTFIKKDSPAERSWKRKGKKELVPRKGGTLGAPTGIEIDAKTWAL